MRAPKPHHEPDHEPDPAESAIAEAEAQLKVIQALAKIPAGPNRANVTRAIAFLCEADALVPGILDQFIRGAK
jgi:hypothetical protein